MDTRNGTYIAYDATGICDAVNSNQHTYKQMREWERLFPGRFSFVNMDDVEFSVQHPEGLSEMTVKRHMEQQMAKADNMLVVASPVLNTESEILNWQISRGVNHFHLPIIVAYAGLELMTEDTIEKYWTWLPAKFKKYITRYPWAQMAHIPLTRDKLQRAMAHYSARRQQYPWDAVTIF